MPDILPMASMFLSDSTYEKLSLSTLKYFPTSTLKQLNENILFPLRRRYLTKILAPHFRDSRNVLDLGASDGRLAAALQARLGEQQMSVEFVGCDVHVQPKTYIPIIQYDGTCVPFADRSFDCVMLVDVLHHTRNPLDVLQEAIRVARKTVIIKDHYWSNPKDFTSLKFADYIGNQPYGIHLPYEYLSETDWQDLFAQCGLTITKNSKFRFNLLDPCKHVLFRLQV